MKFRALPLTTQLKAFSDAVDVYMLNPNRTVMRRWLSRRTNLGAVSLEYPLSEQPHYGNWTIQVIAQGQVEEHQFRVEEYCELSARNRVRHRVQGRCEATPLAFMHRAKRRHRKASCR